jgi:hypothetical protein
MMQERRPMATSIRSEPDHYTIPDTILVVVHVVHLGGAIGANDNPQDSLIYNLIKNLNLYYSATYPDDAGLNRSSGADIGIYFKLADKTPSCEPSNGIVRVNGNWDANYMQYGVSVEGSNGMSQEALTKMSYWNNTKYLNIWLVTKVGNNAFNGYAYYPTGSRTIYDGVIINSKVLARPRILAHEIGHSFSLFHTFEGSTVNACAVNNNCEQDGDRVCDTDPALAYTEGCYTTYINPCTQRPYDNLIFNQMGYTCGAIFTNGQKARIRSALLNYRSTMLAAAKDNLGPCVLQPVTFLSIETEKKGCSNIQIKWRTKNEQNNSRYDIEYSSNRTVFSLLATVQGNNSLPDTSEYRYNYLAQNNGQVFFRIKQVAFDGWFGYSEEKSETVDCAKNEYSVYPNPVVNWLTISTGINLLNTIAIYNAVGQQMDQWQNTSIKNFDLSRYTSGVYFLVVNGSVKLRFIKQ